MAWYSVSTWGKRPDGTWESMNDGYMGNVTESVARNEAEFRRTKVLNGAWDYDPFFYPPRDKKARHTKVMVTTQVWDGTKWATVPSSTFAVDNPIPRG